MGFVLLVSLTLQKKINITVVYSTRTVLINKSNITKLKNIRSENNDS